MSTVTEYFSTDHRQCDEFFALSEGLVDKENWSEGKEQFSSFLHRMEEHFRMEEETLFPEFEKRTGMTQGPTAVMRMEHQTMRELFTRLQQAVAAEDRKTFLGLSENLLFVMQQHNSKEEQMLYPTADRVLGGDAASMVEELVKTRV